MTTKLQFNAFQLKIIALIIMTIDHLGFYQTLTANPQINSIFRIIGRIAAPIFLFLVTEALHHTRSKTKYLIRLYIAAVITGTLNALFFNTIAIGYSTSALGNIFITFFYVAFYIYFIEILLQSKNNKTKIYSLIALLIPILAIFLNIKFCTTTYQQIIHILFPSPLTINYSILFVLIGIVWYFTNNKATNCVILAITSIFSFLIPDTAIPHNTEFFQLHTLFINPQWCMFLAIPFILIYNGEKGKSLKSFFYIYYPLHQYYLFLIYLLTHTKGTP